MYLFQDCQLLNNADHCAPAYRDGFVARADKTQALFGTGNRALEFQYWSSMSTVLTRLELLLPRETLREDRSAGLCQLTRLNRLVLHSEGDQPVPAEDIIASIRLDLPLLDGLCLSRFGATQVRLNCPKLQKLLFLGVVLKSFSGMPHSIRFVRVSLIKGSVPVKAIFPADSGKLLEELSTLEDAEEVTEPETFRGLCLNGRLKHLSIKFGETKLECDGAAAGAFSVHAPWQVVPKTLKDVCLDLPLDQGIPIILEQLLSLEKLSLRHSKRTRMHLDRRLDPCLDMPRLAQATSGVSLATRRRAWWGHTAQLEPCCSEISWPGREAHRGDADDSL